jgi:phage portal protein BeeE
MDEDKLNEFKHDFQNKNYGKKNSITPLIKANGINYETLDTGISQTREGTDLIENRRFQVEEISRIFGVPKQMLDGTAGWSQEIFISFVQN